MPNKILIIALAGSVGTLARYGLAGAVQRLAGGDFPYGTLAVNILGCFAAGLLWTLAENRLNLTGDLRAGVFIGFMGAFTTFSTYMLETSHMIRESAYLAAFGNITLHNVAGLAALFLGIIIGRSIAPF